MKYNINDVKQIIGNFPYNYIEFFGSGNHCEAYCINDDFVIKLPKHKTASKHLNKEIYLLENLSNKFNIELTNIIAKGTFKKDKNEFVYFISKKLHGKKLSHTEFLNLSAVTKEKIALVLANFLFKFHQLKQVFKITRKDYALLHGDFSLNHILFDENNIPCGILDFADTKIGKPISDFVYLLDETDNEEFGEDFGELVLKLYKLIAMENKLENYI